MSNINVTDMRRYLHGNLLLYMLHEWQGAITILQNSEEERIDTIAEGLYNN